MKVLDYRFLLAFAAYVGFLIWLNGCSDETSLNRFCPSECYAIEGISKSFPGPPHIHNIQKTRGVCQGQAGVPICDEAFNIVECAGEVLPEYFEIV